MQAEAEDRKAFKIGLAEGDAIWFIGSLVTLLTHAEETNKQLGLTEWVGPRGMCAPPHSHTFEAEGFYIIEGDVTVKIGGREFNCQRGDFAYVPKTVPHEFMVTSAVAKFLCTITPGGFEEFFRELSDGPAKAPTWPYTGGTIPSLDRLMAAGTKFGWQPETGERSVDPAALARIFSSPCHSGAHFKLGGGLIVFKAMRDQTEDKFSLSEWFGSRGWKVPSLKYTRQGTSYYGLDGEFSVRCGDEHPLSVRAGELVYVPAGVGHSIEVTTGLGRILVCATESVIEDLASAGSPAGENDALLNSPSPIDRKKLRSIGSEKAAWSLI